MEEVQSLEETNQDLTLKLQHYKEQLVQKEEQIANLRVEITKMDALITQSRQNAQNLNAELEELRQGLANASEEVVQAEVVE